MDTPPSLESQLRAYLSYQMMPDERAAFEVLLRTDQATRDAYLRFSMQEEGADMLAQTEQLRNHAHAFRELIGPLPEPNITWLDRLRISWYARPWRTGLFVLLVPSFCTVLGLLMWANLGGLRKVDEVVTGSFMPPPCVEVYAGTIPTGSMSQREIFEKAAKFYCDITLSGTADSLRTLTAQHASFSLANYYLGHFLLKERQWTAAKVALEQCLQQENISQVQKLEETRDLSPLRLNLLLARLGETGRYNADIRTDVATLIASLPTGHPARKVAASVRNEMESPLRRLKIR